MSNEKDTQPAETARYIKLEPDFQNLFNTFSREAAIQADNLIECQDLGTAAAVLNALDMCAQTMTSKEMILKFRDVIHEVAQKVVQARDGRQVCNFELWAIVK